MEVRLSKENYFINEDGTFNQIEALKTAGLKAAVCFKPGAITPWDIRDKESDEILIKRGIGTITADHVTPSQQVPVSLEIYDIPKIICMYLNNLGMQAADERSLRYTEVKDNDYLTNEEIETYNKWMTILQEVLWNDYHKYFMMSNNNDEKKAKMAIKKMAQENARSFITVFMPTSLTITSNFSEFNKLALQIERTINAKNNTELEELAIPYLKDFLNQLKKLGVVITNHDIWLLDTTLDTDLATELKIPNNDKYLYRDTKGIELNLFANKNKFSGISMPDEFGVSFHATRDISFAGFAQLQRHRTLRTELEVRGEEFFVPEFIKSYKELVREWYQDIYKIKNLCYPQGQMIRVGMEGTLKDLISYIGSERACNRAQYEISKFYLDLLNDYKENFKNGNAQDFFDENYADLITPYLGVYRCRTKDYKCPTPCPGGPRENRKF